MSDEGSEEPVDVVVAACADVRRTRRMADCDSLVEQHPEFAVDIAIFLEDYDRVDTKLAPWRELLGRAAAAGEDPTVAGGGAAALAAPVAGSSFGDYELLSEISRGGMGVVFQARQRSLNRIVALKMVLAVGTSATDSERFLVEARAVARLSHRHIVPIYEVGEHGGRPFFTMEFISGGSLRERTDEFRSDQRAMAQLLATVARAVEHGASTRHFASLLEAREYLAGRRREPHVTDFGLAKRLDEESSLTQAVRLSVRPVTWCPNKPKR